MKRTAIALALVGALALSANAQYSTSGQPGGSGSGGGFLGDNPCTVFDDGTTENSLGLTAGGWMCHLQYIDCLAFVEEISSAYGSAMFPGAISNGRPTRIVLWRDDSADTDPSTNTVKLWEMATTVTNGNTDMLNPYPTPGLTVSNSQAWIGAAVQHSAGEFPGPMDVDNPTDRAWIFGNALPATGIDLDNINNNSVAPDSMNNLGFPAAWLLRADGMDAPPQTGTAICFCDPGSAFPGGACGNPGDVGNGCANGSFAEGCNLGATGSTNPDNVVLHAAGAVPSQPGLFFQGENAIAGGNGVPFGDGLRCVGLNVIRLEIVVPNASGDADSSIVISDKGMVTPGSGDVRHYQFWYRDPLGSLCGATFNLSNGYTITW